MKITRDNGWMSAKVGEELVMMNVAKGNYLGLSAIGARIFELLEAPRDLDGLCARLQSEFEVTPAQCRAEVEAFLAQLAEHGVVTLEP